MRISPPMMTRLFAAAIAVASPLVAAPAWAQNSSVLFDDMTVGQPPRGFTPDLTGGGGPVLWRIETDPAEPRRGKVLVQKSIDRTGDRYPICLFDQVRTINVDVTVSFKIVSGQIDRAAGIVLRATDAGNYYAARVSAKENDVRLYRFIGGTGAEMASANVSVPSGEWQTLRFKIDDERLSVFLNDKPVLAASDNRHTRAGRVGLWTHSDSVTMFDDMTVILGRQ